MMQQGASAKAKFRKIASFHRMYALGLILLAVVIRLLLSALGWPTTNSDEATMGLMGLHILHQGDHPIFFYGQSYMGSLEAYLAVVPFHLFGASVFTLRLVLIFMFALFLWCMYLLTSLLYTKEFALICLNLLCLGSREMLTRQLQANGGYIETLLLAAFNMLLATWLVLSFKKDRSHGRLLRLGAYGCWGLSVGLSLWSDPITIPFLLAAGALLIIFCWREVLTWAPLCLLLGVFLGACPLIFYNLTAPAGYDTWSALQHVQNMGSNIPNEQINAIAGAILISLPAATGATPLCGPYDVITITNKPLNPHSLSTCAIVQGVWGIGYLILLTVALLLGVLSVWHFWRTRASWKVPSPASASDPPVQERQEAKQGSIRQMVVLALLGAAALAIILYARTPAAAFAPMTDARYLTDLLIVTPALLWPLWRGKGFIPSTQPWLARVSSACKRGLLLLIGTSFVIGTITTFSLVPGARAVDQQQETFVHNLLQVKATRIYSDYWTCDRVAFQSQERIICSVLDPDSHRCINCYEPYKLIVDSDPHAAYVCMLHSVEAAAVASMVAHSQKRYRRMVFDGYVIYQPESG